jgi:CelD/BcsL family acetyltransferase involved in cellulose biosynthesis
MSRILYVMPAMYEIKLFSTFDEARSDWKRAEEQGTLFPFQSYEWLSPWFTHIATTSNLTPALISVKDPAGRPMMFLPLGIERRRLARCLVWLGGVNTDYQAPILGHHLPEDFSPKEFLKLWKKILGALPPIDAICFEKQPERIGDKTNPFMYLPSQANPNNSHSARLGKPWKDFYNEKRSSKSRGTERRKEKLLKQHGEISFSAKANESEVEDVLNWLILNKSKRNAAIGTGDIFSLPGYSSFYADLIDANQIHLEIVLSVLRLDKTIIAAHWGLIHDGCFYWLIPAFDEEGFGTFSPGAMLLRNLLKWSCDRDLDRFDFTIGDEEYKEHWCDTTLKLHDTLNNLTWRGRLYLMGVKSKRGILEVAKERPRLAAAIRGVRRLRTAKASPILP